MEREREDVPHEENNLGAVSIGAGVVVELQNGITAVISGELLEELRVGGRGVGSLQEGDGLVVSRQTQDHVAVLVAELEVVELRDDGLVNSNTGRLRIIFRGFWLVSSSREGKKAGRNMTRLDVGPLALLHA